MSLGKQPAQKSLNGQLWIVKVVKVEIHQPQPRNGKDGNLLNPDVVNPYLDKVVLWFEDADMAEEPTTFQTYSDKLAEVEEFIKKEGAPYFEKKAKDTWKQAVTRDQFVSMVLWKWTIRLERQTRAC